MGMEVLRPFLYASLTFAWATSQLACSGETRLGGESGKAGTKEATTEDAAEPPTVEVKTDAVVDREAPVASLDGSPEAEEDEEEDEVGEDLRVIPPEVVTGAYLTCVGLDDDGAAVPTDAPAALVGCSLQGADGETLDLTDVAASFEIIAADGLAVAKQKLPITPEDGHHVLWRLDEPLALDEMYASVSLNSAAENVSIKEMVRQGEEIELVVTTE